MRVNLQYSVELEEVPELIAELIEDEAGRLSHCDHVIDQICENLRGEDLNASSIRKKIDNLF